MLGCRHQSKTPGSIEEIFRPVALRTCSHVIQQLQEAHDDVRMTRREVLGIQAQDGADNVCSWMWARYSAMYAATMQWTAPSKVATAAAAMDRLRVLDRDIMRPIVDCILRGRKDSYPSLVRALEGVVAPCTHGRPVMGIQLEGVHDMLVRALLGFASDSDDEDARRAGDWSRGSK